MNAIGDNEVPGTAGPVDLGAGAAAASSAAATTIGGRPRPDPSRACRAGRARGTAEGLQGRRRQALGRRPPPCAGAERRPTLRRAARGEPARRSGGRRLPAPPRAHPRVRRDAACALGRSRGDRAVFRSVGTNNKNAPAAQRYLVKQSLRPIRTKRDFERAFALCSGGCSFKIIRIGARLNLTVNRLKRSRRYYYAIAARDNVSSLPAPRSRPISPRTR